MISRSCSQLLRSVATGALLIACALNAGCGKPAEKIRIDGSSTVYPISEAVAEVYTRANPGARVTVGLSGTGGGFQKFAAGEIDICDASREIRESEIEACKESGADYVRLSVAFDGIAIVVNPENDWVDCLTVEQLASIWRPDDPVQNWSDLDPDWPEKPIKLYGPGTDSGTFDYFTKAIVGEEKASRADFTASEDDNVLVTGVSQDTYSLGYFGLAFYTENADRLRLLGIQAEEGECVQPTLETVRTNEYRPLSRPLFIYVRSDLFARPSGKAFIDFYLENAGELAEEVGYIEVSEEVAAENAAALDSLNQPAPGTTEQSPSQ